MRKVLVALVALTITLGMLGISKSEAKSVKVKRDKEPAGTEMVVKRKSDLPEKAKVVKEDVVFYDYDTTGGGTIYLIKDKKLVMMPTRGLDKQQKEKIVSWKRNPLQKETKKIKVTMSYDPELLTYVVTDYE